MSNPEKEKWSKEKMQEHRNSWTLAADTQLLYYMQQFSQNLLGETHSTLKAVDELESQIASTSVTVNNLGSNFWALSDTQFVENRVYDDDEMSSPVVPTPQKGSEEVSETVVISRLKEALQNGYHVLDTKFEMIQVADSDSDDDNSSPNTGVVMKPLNRYKERRLPHLIGSSEFSTDETLGLRDTPSDEEIEDFLSASDKAYDSDDSDSDIESLTRPQNLLVKHKSGSLQTHLPESSKLHSPATPSSDLMDEDEGKSLFEAVAPIYSYRPPSAGSSVISAQSSNMSEPVKKTNEDFGKSGLGRMPVSVQDEHSDFLESSPAASQQPQTKKPIPAGGIKLFHDNFNFPVGKHESSEESDHSHRSRWEDESDNVNKRLPRHASKSLFKQSSPPNVSKSHDDDLFADNDNSSDLFSGSLTKPIVSKPSSSKSITKTQLPNEVKSRTSNSDLNVSDNLFSYSSEEDDLFSGKGLFSNPKDKHIFAGDAYNSGTENLFSGTGNYSKKKDVSQSNEPDPLFGEKSRLKNIGQSNLVKVGKNSFPDEDDLFADLESSGNNLFGSTPAVKHIGKKSSSPNKNDLFTSKTVSNHNFWADKDDDLFQNMGTTSSKSIDNEDLLFDNNYKISNKAEISGGHSSSLLKSTEEQIKSKFDTPKLKKGPGVKSIFESDSDDDLFSSPQGSLGSKKSFQITSSIVDSKNKPQLKKDNKEDLLVTKSKASFSSIFSEDTKTQNLLSTSLEISPNDLFKDNEDLFGSLKVVENTPELFASNSDVIAGDNDNEFTSKIENDEYQSLVEATNTELLSKVSSFDNKEFDSTNRSAFEQMPTANKNVGNVKSDPPKTLDIRPVLDTQTTTKTNLAEEKTILEKPPIVKSPRRKSDSRSDSPDGDATKPPCLPKPLPGKLKTSQLININPAALLPGSKPLTKSAVSPENELEEEGVVHSSSSPEELSETMPDTPTDLLQSVVRERPKIQVKRRPPSRRARQAALRASSIEDENEDTTTPTPSPVSSNVMSPSTEEEDLFGVPPLGLITSDDAKTNSPKTDIFGTPAVLSPDSPSSYYPSPFVSSQPPPLEEEDMSTQYDDIYDDQDLFDNFIKDKNLSTKTSRKSIPKNRLFEDDDDDLFSDFREKPPPIIIGDDDDEDDDIYRRSETTDIFSESENKRFNALSLSPHVTSSVSTSHDLLSNSAANKTIENNKITSIPDIYSSKTASNANETITKTLYSDNNLFSSSDTTDTNPLIQETIKYPDEGKSTSYKENVTISDKSNRRLSPSFKDLFSDDDLFSSTVGNVEKKPSSNDSSTLKQSVHKAAVESSDSDIPKTSSDKHKSLFDNDDDNPVDSTDIFVPKVTKSMPSVRQSLFGDDEDDDDSSIFGFSTVNKNIGSSVATVPSMSSKTPPKASGIVQKSVKSRKPVKLEATEAFSDPLLGNPD